MKADSESHDGLPVSDQDGMLVPLMADFLEGTLPGGLSSEAEHAWRCCLEDYAHFLELARRLDVAHFRDPGHAPSTRCLSEEPRVEVKGSFSRVLNQPTVVNPPQEISSRWDLDLPTEGTVFGPFDQLQEIAAGGMGVVYKARQRQLNRIVALKRIRAGHLATPSEVRRFEIEAEAAARLHHPHIVPIYEVGQHEGQPYYTMKFVEGGSLAQHLPRFYGHPRETAQLLATVARAVHFAHQNRVIHRDLKPANILLEGSPTSPLGALIPQVTDFGLAKQLDAGTNPGKLAGPPTNTGDIIGTPCYMAPEQARGQRQVTTAVDVYALGAILFEMLTDRPPFRESSSMDTLMRVISDPPPRPRQFNRKIPRDLETITLKCLDKTPEARFASADALADDLERWLTGKPIHARRTSMPERILKWARRKPVVAGLTLLLLIVAGLGFAGVVWKWRDEARVRRELAHTLYFQTIALAERELSANNVGRGLEMLHGPNCPAHLRGWEWHYLIQATHPYPPTLEGNKNPLFCVAASPDGKYFLTGGGGPAGGHPSHQADRPRALAAHSGWGEVKVWDTVTGDLITTFGPKEHTGWIRGLAYHPEGYLLATASSDKTVILWDTRTWTLKHRLTGHTVHLWCVAFSPDGQWLASGGGGKSPEDDGEIIVWDPKSGNPIHSISRPKDRIWKLAFHPQRSGDRDKHQLAFAGEDHRVRVWEIPEQGKEPRETHCYDGLPSSAVSVAYSPNGEYLAAGSGTHHTGDPSVILVWETATGQRKCILTGHANEIWGLTFSPQGDRLVSASHDQTIKLWDIPKERETLTLRGHTDNVRAVCFLPALLQGNPAEPGEAREHARLVSVSEDHTAKVWEPIPILGRHLSPSFIELDGPTQRMWKVVYSPDGSRLAAAGDPGVVYLWPIQRVGDRNTYLPGVKLTGHEKSVRGLAFSPDGRKLASASYDNTIRIWDVATTRSRVLTGEEMGWVHGVAFSPDGQRVVGVKNYTVGVWDADSGKPLGVRTPEHTWVVSQVLFRPTPQGNHQFITASWDQTILIWDLQQQKRIRTLRGHSGRVQCLTVFPDGKTLASAGNDGTIMLWDLDTGKEIRVLKGHSDAIVSLSSCLTRKHPQGNSSSRVLLASASRDQTVRIWDSLTGDTLLTLRGHVGQLHGVAFSPEGDQLAVASGSGGKGRVRVWQLKR